MKQAARRKHHYIYKVTKIDTGRYYIGMHSTDDLGDGYFGSGKIITASIKKHGKDKHIKEILEHLPTREALKLREKELINEELLSDKLCMNLKLGGDGNAPGDVRMIAAIKAAHSTPEAKARSSKNTKDLWETEEFRKKMAENNQPARQKARWTDDAKKKHASKMEVKWADPEFKESVCKNISVAVKATQAIKGNAWVGRKHSETSKNKMSLSASEREREAMQQSTKDKIAETHAKKSKEEKQRSKEKRDATISKRTQDQKDLSREKLAKSRNTIVRINGESYLSLAHAREVLKLSKYKIRQLATKE